VVQLQSRLRHVRSRGVCASSVCLTFLGEMILKREFDLQSFSKHFSSWGGRLVATSK
jgi:putative tryptophan/tyrosine transport system substrate-binding protein